MEVYARSHEGVHVHSAGGSRGRTSSGTAAPAAGALAIGFDLGIFSPDTNTPPEQRFKKTLAVDGLAEFYLGPRFSVRGMLAWCEPELDRFPQNQQRQTRLVGNVLYNWEGGNWHPFATAGVGAYFLKLTGPQFPLSPTFTHAGVNAGGGIEYFAVPGGTFKFEVTYHWVNQGDVLYDPLNASGLNLTVGLKKYF
jgi:hypothetical protein